MKQFTKEELVIIKELVDNILRWRKSYYNGTPEVPDNVYDGAEMLLKEYIPDHPIFSQVGCNTDGFDTINYVEAGADKMLSLDKVYSAEEVIKFIGNKDYVAMMKLDGMSIRAIYEDGKLILAHTRGNGTFGDIVTNNFYFVDGAIPERINKSKKFEVRGEICVTNGDFEIANKERAANGEEIFKNPRSATASFKQKDFVETAKVKFVFLAYVLKIHNEPELSKKEQLSKLEQMGFITPIIREVNNLSINDSIKECIELTTESRPKLPIIIDGIVFALNDVDVRNSLGCTGHHPKYEIAYKFASDEGVTILKDVEWEVSRTGKIKPTGIIEPIELGGAVNTRVTLNNPTWMIENRAAIGEEIYVKRAGDVIPNFVGAVKPIEEIPESSVIIPTHCPSCGTKAVMIGVELCCPNKDCKGIAIKKIKYYVSKAAADIDGVGDKLIEQLFEANLIKTPADLFTLTEEKLKDIDRMGSKKAKNTIEAINKSREQTMEVFLHSMGIDSLGKDISAKIADHFDVKTMTVTIDLLTVDNIAEKTADAITKGLIESKPLAEELLKYVVIKQKQISQKPNIFNGKSFCVSGHIELNFKNGEHYEERSAIQDIIKSYGGTIKSSVSKKLDYLVAGPGSGSKSDDAMKFGVPIIDGDKLMKMIE